MISPNAVENSRESVLNEDTIESTIPSEKQAQAQAMVRFMCGDNVDACQWLYDVFNLSLTWDHIEDDDEIDKKLADSVFTNIVTQWPFNNFYNQNSAILAIIWSNCISAWKSVNRRDAPKIKAYDIFCETTSTVCFLIHGQEGVDKWMPEYRRLMWEICQEDDLKDGGKL